MMADITLSFSVALLMGLTFGAGPCNITCLPFLGPVFLGQNRNNMQTSWKTIIPFSLGRLTGYTLLGTIAGAFGLAATKWIEEGIASQILGIATTLVGIYLVFGAYSNKKSCASHHSAKIKDEQPIYFNKTPSHKNETQSTLYLSISLFAMGTGMALNPCIPLVTILTIAATMATPVGGAKLGIAFGLGAVVIPSLFFAFAISYFSQQIKEHLNQWGKKIEQLSGFMLIFLGIFTGLGWIQV